LVYRYTCRKRRRNNDIFINGMRVANL